MKDFTKNTTEHTFTANGAVLPIPDYFKKEGHLLVLESEDGKALAIYIHHPEKPGMMKPAKVLRSVE